MGEGVGVRGRGLLAFAGFAGVGVAALTRSAKGRGRATAGLAVATLSGGIVLNMPKEERPKQQEARFRPLVAAAALYSLLLHHHDLVAQMTNCTFRTGVQACGVPAPMAKTPSAAKNDDRKVLSGQAGLPPIPQTETIGACGDGTVRATR